MQKSTDKNDLFGFIALDGKDVVACIFFTRLKFETGINAFILSPVAVATKEQGKGVGQKRIKFGIERLRKAGVELVFTYGDISFYSKVGFKYIIEDVVKAPLNLTYPDGWLAQLLVSNDIQPIPGDSICVEALITKDIGKGNNRY